MTKEQLFQMALEARNKAYAPYSSHPVGAALVCDDDSTFTGCNVENASYGLTCCAERNAIFSAVAAGKKDIKMIAIAGGMINQPLHICPPCGACRQVMREFNKNMQIVLGSDTDDLIVKSLEELLPMSFGPENLDKP